MRFPPYLFGIHMTAGLWYFVIFLVALLVIWIILKVFKTVIKDFASGFIIFVMIVIFGFIFLNLVSGANSISSGFDSWFQRYLR